MEQTTAQTWGGLEDEDLWFIQPDEMSLLPGRSDKGRLGFALQLKFRQVYGRYPERLDEFAPPAIDAVATQVGVNKSALLADRPVTAADPQSGHARREEDRQEVVRCHQKGARQG